MAMDEMSPQRKNAYYKWRQAQQELQKGHADKAIDLARTALEEDPEYLDLRMWLVQVYMHADDTRRAARELEEIIHIQRDHQEAWNLLRRIDPAAAQRLERLRDIAPDPFVMKRTKPLSEEVVDADDILEEEEWGAAGGIPGAVGPDPFVSKAQSDELIPMDEAYEAEGEAACAESTTPSSASQTPRRGGYAWEFEQDREYLAKWEAEPVVASMTAKIQALWSEIDPWEPVLSLCAHADRHLHPQIFEATEKAAAKLGVEMPEILVVPERCMHPVIIKDHSPMIVVPTGLIRAMTPEQMLFQIGREIGHIHTGYVAQMQVVKIITDRRSQLVGDCASTLTEVLKAHLKGWDEHLTKEQITRLKKLGHAWQQRCELTADRAGLICCGDIATACTTIAKTTARSIDEATTLTCERFLKQFEGQDVGALAAIPVEESPSRNPQYAAYRIHMLRWWANTPAGKAILAS